MSINFTYNIGQKDVDKRLFEGQSGPALVQVLKEMHDFPLHEVGEGYSLCWSNEVHCSRRWGDGRSGWRGKSWLCDASDAPPPDAVMNAEFTHGAFEEGSSVTRARGVNSELAQRPVPALHEPPLLQMPQAHAIPPCRTSRKFPLFDRSDVGTHHL